MNTQFPPKPVNEMTLVEISQQLERITKLIEDERVKERDARAVYDVVAKAAEANIAAIKKTAQELRNAHLKKVSAFDGLLGVETAPARSNFVQRAAPAPRKPGSKQNIQDAIFAIWDNSRFARTLTTDDIIDGLRANGFATNASERSLKSSINQNLAKLCRVEKVIRLRADGSKIGSRDTTSRAKMYIAAKLLPEE